MKQADRIEALEGLFETFVGKAREGGYIVLETTPNRDQYVQFRLHDGVVRGEVGSRQWEEPERPLPQAAVSGLAALGFVGGGPEKNYTKDGIRPAPSELASLTDTLMRTAYGVDDEYSFTVHSLVFNDVTLPRATRFSRDMIEQHLRFHQVKFLRDDDGDFRADFFSEGMSGPVLVWLCAVGDAGAGYQVTSVAPAGPTPATRDEALERCNEWNAEHFWPKAWVRINHDGCWQVMTGADLDCSPGVTQELVDTFTCNVIHGSLEFWSRLASPQPSTPATDSADGGG